MSEVSKFKPLLNALESGTLSPSQLSTVSQALHLGLLNSALDAIGESDALLGKLKSMESRALEFLEERFEQFVDLADWSQLLEFLGDVAKIRKNSVDAKMKIYSTRDLFNLNPISEDDRALLGLFKMVDSTDKRVKLRKFLESLNDDIIDIPSDDVTSDVEDEACV